MVILACAWLVLFMRGPVAEIRRNEIENRLKRGLPVNATARAEEFLVSEDAVRRDLFTAFEMCPSKQRGHRRDYVDFLQTSEL